MTWCAIYEIPKDNLPVLRGKFDTKEEALRWVKTQESGDYALFTHTDFGWTFLPINPVR